MILDGTLGLNDDGSQPLRELLTSQIVSLHFLLGGDVVVAVVPRLIRFVLVLTLKHRSALSWWLCGRHGLNFVQDSRLIVFSRVGVSDAQERLVHAACLRHVAILLLFVKDLSNHLLLFLGHRSFLMELFLHVLVIIYILQFFESWLQMVVGGLFSLLFEHKEAI